MVRDVVIIITEESALNGKAIVGWTFASLVEYRMGFATVQEPNSGGVSGRSYKRRYTRSRSIIGSVR